MSRKAILALSLLLLSIMQPALAQTITIPLTEQLDPSEKDNKDLPSGSHQIKALMLRSEGKFKEAEEEELIVLNRANKSGDQMWIASAKFLLASIYRGQERFDDSLKNYEKVLAFYKPKYVILRWSNTRKRYERQGILVDGQAIDKVEQETGITLQTNNVDCETKG